MGTAGIAVVLLLVLLLLLKSGQLNLWAALVAVMFGLMLGATDQGPTVTQMVGAAMTTMVEAVTSL
jgi:hypothetical protein